ncbi:MAG: amidohydrolase family protein [Solirubrobacteraceae bacterium]
MALQAPSKDSLAFSGGALVADHLLEPWYRAISADITGLKIFDAHTHIGCADPDGSCVAADELTAAVELVDGHAVVFPLAEPVGYAVANERILEAGQRSDGRLVPFCRADPHGAGIEEVKQAVDGGAVGIKLHPRSEHFMLGEPAVERIVAYASEHRLPVIVHAGRGIPSLGRDALTLTQRYPDVTMILAHLAISDLSWLWSEAGGQRNLLFDTAWWNTADQLTMFSMMPPGQIVFGSDAPYGRPIATATFALRAALACGLNHDQIRSVFGGQLARILSGEAPLDLGPATMTPPPSPGPLLERLHTLLVAAAARLTAGYPADEYLELVELACEIPSSHPAAPVAASVRTLLHRYLHHSRMAPPQRGPRIPGIHLIFVAETIARTPGLPLPALGPSGDVLVAA